MYHSITFGDKNTWDDWRIVPSSRPLFNPPKQKTAYIDIPGASGSLDLSEALTKYPVYSNREGTLEFHVTDDYKSRHHKYAEIMEYLHGRVRQAVLEDDKEFFYQGRFAVSDWKSAGAWSILTIEYNLNPYKWRRTTSTENWWWDTLNFQNGVIQQPVFKDLRIDSEEIEEFTPWAEKKFSQEFIGIAPICPNFIVDSDDESGLDVRYINSVLNIDKEVHLNEGINVVPECIFYGLSEYSLFFKGHGKVSIDFRSGGL